MIYAITSGYYNPLHVGHISLFREAWSRCNGLYVIVNNDKQVLLKKGRLVIPENDRLEVVRAIRYVNEAVLSVDHDPSVMISLHDAAKTLRARHGDDLRLVFCKGGDSTAENVIERDVCKQMGIAILLGIGGSKRDSSSRIIDGAGI